MWDWIALLSLNREERSQRLFESHFNRSFQEHLTQLANSPNPEDIQAACWGTFCLHQGTSRKPCSSRLSRTVARHMVTREPGAGSDLEAVGFLKAIVKAGMEDSPSPTSQEKPIARQHRPVQLLVSGAVPARVVVSRVYPGKAQFASSVNNTYDTLSRVNTGSFTASNRILLTRSTASVLTNQQNTLNRQDLERSITRLEKVDLSFNICAVTGPYKAGCLISVSKAAKKVRFTTHEAMRGLVTPPNSPVKAGSYTGFDRYRLYSKLDREERIRRIETACGDLLEITARYFWRDGGTRNQTVPGHPDITYTEILERKLKKRRSNIEEIVTKAVDVPKGSDLQWGFQVAEAVAWPKMDGGDTAVGRKISSLERRDGVFVFEDASEPEKEKRIGMEKCSKEAKKCEKPFSRRRARKPIGRRCIIPRRP